MQRERERAEKRARKQEKKEEKKAFALEAAELGITVEEPALRRGLTTPDEAEPDEELARRSSYFFSANSRNCVNWDAAKLLSLTRSSVRLPPAEARPNAIPRCCRAEPERIEVQQQRLPRGAVLAQLGHELDLFPVPGAPTENDRSIEGSACRAARPPRGR